MKYRINIHKTIDKVTNDLLSMNYNTAVSSLMILLNEYENLGNNTILAMGTWLTFDEEKTVDTSIQVGVQVNGKLRGTITVNDDDTEDMIREKALNEDNVKKNIIDKEIVKIIVVPKRIVSIVVR